MTPSEPSETHSLFRRALITEDEAYTVVESRLRALPESAPVMRENLDHPDPIGRLLAGVMLDWTESEDHDFDVALRRLDQLERRFASTVAGAPSPVATADNLTARFGGRLAELLALRLVKEPRQEQWRALTALAYLDRHRTPAVSDALIRFAAITPDPHTQQLAARVLGGIGDPALARKIAAERERLAAQGRSMPPAIAALASVPSGIV